MFLSCNVWCSLKLLQLKTEGRAINIHRKPHQNVAKKLKSKFSLTLGSVIGLLTTRPSMSRFSKRGMRLLHGFAAHNIYQRKPGPRIQIKNCSLNWLPRCPSAGEYSYKLLQCNSFSSLFLCTFSFFSYPP